MTDLENKIYQAIKANNGIKGAEIAKLVNEDKKIVNSTLSHSSALKALVSQDSSYCWRIKHQAVHNNIQSDTSIPVPDTELRNLCNYYLNCIALESGSAVSQFLESQYSLKYAILHGLEIVPDTDKEALTLLTEAGKDHNKVTYLGYPVQIFSFTGKNGIKYRKIAPVFMFPVSYNGGKVEITSVPSINMEVIKKFTGNSSEAQVVEMIELEKELGLDSPGAEIEKDELVLRLIEIRQWDYKERIDPYNISSLPFDKSVEDGIYNRAIVIETDKEPYTQGLESELMTLANMPEENYKDTALYAWIHNNNTQVSSDNIKPLIEVLPLNSEQSEAVNTALRSDLTIITGPPGTGKSQVVTDLLINIIWNRKNALFSSKNNKAVDVVEQRVNALSKKPVLLRIGGFQMAEHLAEIVEGLLSSHPDKQNSLDAENLFNEYLVKYEEASKIQEKKEIIRKARNELDMAEQKYCSVRNRVGRYINNKDLPEKGIIAKSAEQYITASDAATKEKQNIIIRLFWGLLSKKRIKEKTDAAAVYDRFAIRYDLMTAAEAESNKRLDELTGQADEFEEALQTGETYVKASSVIKSLPSLEELDRQLLSNKEELARIAGNLWDKWVLSKPLPISPAEREEMSSFVATIKLLKGVGFAGAPGLKNQYNQILKKMTKYLQCWAVTSLSVKNKVPFEPGLFDYLIIDEASQCDIASIIPLLYRAKRAVIIGDPKQLSHISQLSNNQDLNLIQKYNVKLNWSYSATSLYALAAGKTSPDQIILLRDHFRCCADIIEFSNKEFYDGSLRTATKYNKLKTPAGEKPGIRWIDTIGKTIRPESGSAYNQKEAEAVVKELDRLISQGYQGTIGVTTPFKRQAETIEAILQKAEYKTLHEKLVLHHEFIADTVHKFQGDERDIMIFSPVVSIGAPQSTLGFLSSTSRLFNVAITRARAVLVVVGNYNYCSQSEVSYLRDFANYYSKLSLANNKVQEEKSAETYSREYPWVTNPDQVSDWERMFYTALYDAGIQTIPQYPVDKYKLDLALILDENKKLDIEVDGEMYHKQWNGELMYHDQIRNQRMYELGWDVKRFWVYQIRDDLETCIDQIKKWMV